MNEPRLLGRHTQPVVVVAVLATVGVFALGGGAAFGGSCGNEARTGGVGIPLPDCRAYELVTSSSAGEPYGPTSPTYGPAEYSSQLFQAAADGESVAYIGEPGLSGGSGSIGPNKGDQWLATRTSAGWDASLITPAGSEQSRAPVFQAFSPDLSTGFLQATLDPPLTPEAPAGCQVLYERTSATGAYRALVPILPLGETCGHPEFAGASADQSHIIFQTEAALIEGSEPAKVPPGHEERHAISGGITGEPCQFGCNLYDASGGHVRLVNILPRPEEKIVPDATFGGYSYSSGTINQPNFSDAISADGSRIFWTDTEPGPEMEHVYVRENGNTTFQVSGEGPAEYWAATSDGRYAFYTEAGRLWRFDTHSNTREDIVAEGLKGEIPGILGVLGINTIGEDGAYVYFVATAILATNENEYNATAQPEEPNLYLRHGDVTTFIATLARGDEELTGGAGNGERTGDWVPNQGDRAAEVSPDGQHLVFQSKRPLTGYNNEEPSGNLTVDAFVYDASTYRLSCASCDPAGIPPQVFENEQPVVLPISYESGPYMRRWLSADGNRVFFDSSQPLTAADRNGVRDVYEWEREGTGSCTDRLASRINGGCVFLLSGATNGFPSFLVDADESGDNVFFTHIGPLGSAQVANGVNALYDARVDGGFPQEVVLACTGTGCQGAPPAAPVFATPPSATFTASGNLQPTGSGRPRSAARSTRERLAKALRACRAQRGRLQRRRCEVRARRRYHGVRRTTKVTKAGRVPDRRRKR